MSAIEVLSPGMLTTVQDLGRQGFGPMGVSPSGAADPIALRIGNRLAGNPEGAAALEMTLLGGTFLFHEPATIALAGSDFGATLDGHPLDGHPLDAHPLACWTSAEVRSGQTLRVGPTRSGSRCYLCIAGGIAVEPFLGSASTHLLSGLGGFHGRALRKGNVFSCGPVAAFKSRALRLAASSEERRAGMPALHGLLAYSSRRVFRVTAAPQSNWFPESAQRVLYESAYRVAEESNRMGLRLQGPPLETSAHSRGEMITEGISLGAIQVPDSGQLIISFVEQQTTGGYPVIANIISADLPSVGQLRPRDEILFQPVTLAQARALLIEQEKLLASPDLIVEVSTA